MQTIENAVLNDEITEGDHSFVNGTMHVYELEMNADGTVVSETEVTEEFSTGFPLNWEKSILPTGSFMTRK